MHPDAIRKERVWFRLKLTHKFHPPFSVGQLFVVKEKRWISSFYKAKPGDCIIFLSAWAQRGHNKNSIRVFWLLYNNTIVEEYVGITTAAGWRNWMRANFE